MLYVVWTSTARERRRRWLTKRGTSCFNRNVPNDPEKLADVLSGAEPGTSGGVRGDVSVGVGAELLQEMGLDAHLAHPTACKAIASARLKNDKVDARTLAQLLRVDLLGEAAHVAKTKPPFVGAYESIRRRRGKPGA